VFKPAGIFFLCALALLLAGCATSPESGPNEPASLNWPPTNAVVVQAPFNVNRPVGPGTRLNPPPAAAHSNPPPANVVKPAPVFTWDSLNHWAAENKIGPPQRLSDSPVTTYTIGSKNGVMILGIGSREATWNGVVINLGFAPQFIDGEMFLHGLDLQKHLEPLLCGPPLTFGTNRIIVIDAGHGGANTGTRSALDGRFEKEFTLDWAKRLKPLLATNGWTVFLTRTSDVYVTNADRVVFAEAHHADLFISLHFNSTLERDEQTGGLETYCITPMGMPSTLTRGFADVWSENLPNNTFDAQNLQLAFRVHSALLHATGIEDRGVRHSRFDTVLRGQNRPAILIEGGYLSNPAEATLIESADYRQKLAQAVADALK
jgi:N-acetylmuramoyl-L-alanine amidase